MISTVSAPIRWEVVMFVNNCHLYTTDNLEKINLSDATYNLCCMFADGVELPEGITPEEFMFAWNHSIDTMHRYDDLDDTDDSDEI